MCLWCVGVVYDCMCMWAMGYWGGVRVCVFACGARVCVVCVCGVCVVYVWCVCVCVCTWPIKSYSVAM